MKERKTDGEKYIDARKRKSKKFAQHYEEGRSAFMEKVSSQVELGRIASCIHTLRDRKVILDADLARLYGVTTGALNQAVSRNRERFPAQFVFQVTKDEAAVLRSQFVILKEQGHFRFLPYAFTEHGALMAANVLRSKQAVKMSIAIVEAFVRLRKMALSLEDLTRKVNELERGFQKHGRQFEAVFEAIRQLMVPPPEGPRRKIGFHPS